VIGKGKEQTLHNRGHKRRPQGKPSLTRFSRHYLGLHAEEIERVPAALQRTRVYRRQGDGHYPTMVLIRVGAGISAAAKQKVGSELRRQIWVKTGRDWNYYGEMVAAMKRRFDRIYSSKTSQRSRRRADAQIAREARRISRR